MLQRIHVPICTAGLKTDTRHHIDISVATSLGGRDLQRRQHLYLGLSVEACLCVYLLQKVYDLSPPLRVGNTSRRVEHWLNHRNQDTIWHVRQSDVDQLSRMMLNHFLGVVW